MTAAQERFEKLLPFYVTGKISVQDKAYVDEYLGQVPEAAQSLAFTESLRDTIRSQPLTEPNEQRVQSMLQRWSATQSVRTPVPPMSGLAPRRWPSWIELSGGFVLAVMASLVIVMTPGELGVLHLDGLDGKPDLQLRLKAGVSPEHLAVQSALQRSSAVVLARSEQDGKHTLTLDLNNRARTQASLLDELASNGHLDSYTLLASE